MTQYPVAGSPRRRLLNPAARTFLPGVRAALLACCLLAVFQEALEAAPPKSPEALAAMETRAGAALGPRFFEWPPKGTVWLDMADFIQRCRARGGAPVLKTVRPSAAPPPDALGAVVALDCAGRAGQ